MPSIQVLGVTFQDFVMNVESDEVPERSIRFEDADLPNQRPALSLHSEPRRDFKDSDNLMPQCRKERGSGSTMH